MTELHVFYQLVASAVGGAGVASIAVLKYVDGRDQRIKATVLSEVQQQIDELRARVSGLEKSQKRATHHCLDAWERLSSIDGAEAARALIREAIEALR